MKCIVRVLVVVDGEIDFSNNRMGLSHVVQLYKGLHNETCIDCRVTCVHRGSEVNNENLDFENFEFTESFLEKFDCLFLFGYENKMKEMSDSEARVIRKVMKKKLLGVFAAGDHGRHGYDLCGKIRRVRCMQFWNDKRPSFMLSQRNTSINLPAVIYHNDSSNFEMYQRDNRPMRLFNSLYHSYHQPRKEKSSLEPHLDPRFTHPILDGRSQFRQVDVLPDHLHEGEIRRPSPLKKDGDPYINKKQEQEDIDFPGSQRWEIIARAENYDVQSPSQELERETDYGVLGAYNGYLDDRGRIVVDSSFHHWINLNLEGFSRDETSEDSVLKKINSYYVNTLIWLLPPSKQKYLFAAILLEGLQSYVLRDFVDVKMTLPELGRAAIRELGSIYGEVSIRSAWTYFWTEKRYKPQGEPKKSGRRKLVELMDSFDEISNEELMALDETVIGKVVNDLVYTLFYVPNVSLRALVERIEKQVEEGVKEFEKKILQYRVVQNEARHILTSRTL